MKTLLRFILAPVLSGALVMVMAFAPAASAQQYGVRAGDRLEIQVVEDESLNRAVTVLPGGSITFPYAGNMNVGGQSATAIANRISQSLAGVMASPPTVFVNVVPIEPVPTAEEVEEAVINIYIMGEAAQPGAKAVLPGTTFLQALSQAGGLTPFAATKRIQLRRASMPGQVITVNYSAIMRGATMNLDPVLAEGDVIIVPERSLFE